jgi:hypothetical protein
VARKTYIHVNRQKIAQNRKDGRDRPAFTAKDSVVNRYGREVELLDDRGRVLVRFVSAGPGGRKPLNCGARAWAETRLTVRVKSTRSPPLRSGTALQDSRRPVRTR